MTLEDAIGAGLGIGKLAGHQQRVTGLDLRFQGIGHQIRGAGELGGGAITDTGRDVGFAEAEARLAELRIGTDGVAVLDDRLFVLLLCGEVVAAFEVGVLGLVGGFRASDEHADEQRDDKTKTVHLGQGCNPPATPSVSVDVCANLGAPRQRALDGTRGGRAMTKVTHQVEAFRLCATVLFATGRNSSSSLTPGVTFHRGAP